jgi:hypothetical protein
MNLHNLMSLSHLHVIYIKSKELLVDYSQSHVIFNEYLRHHMKKNHGQGINKRNKKSKGRISGLEK